MAVSSTAKVMASQKLTNCGVAAITLTASAYISTPHCSTIARLAFSDFCLANANFSFFAKASKVSRSLF